MQQPLARAEADVLDRPPREIAAHGFGTADRAQQRVVGGVVALRHRAAHEVGIAGGPAAGPDQRGGRLVEERQVLARDCGRVGKPNLAPVDRVEEGHRHPELRHALLREERSAVPGDGPVGPDAADGNADLAIEALAKVADHADEGGRRRFALVDVEFVERLWRVRDALDREGRRGRLRALGGAGLRFHRRADAGGERCHQQDEAGRSAVRTLPASLKSLVHECPRTLLRFRPAAAFE